MILSNIRKTAVFVIFHLQLIFHTQFKFVFIVCIGIRLHLPHSNGPLFTLQTEIFHGRHVPILRSTEN
jgi:hypothetical protein